MKTNTMSSRFLKTILSTEISCRSGLEKLGHSVHLTVNGEDYANARNRADLFDAVLMDIQVSLVIYWDMDVTEFYPIKTSIDANG